MAAIVSGGQSGARKVGKFKVTWTEAPCSGGAAASSSTTSISKSSSASSSLVTTLAPTTAVSKTLLLTLTTAVQSSSAVNISPLTSITVSTAKPSVSSSVEGNISTAAASLIPLSQRLSCLKGSASSNLYSGTQYSQKSIHGQDFWSYDSVKGRYPLA
ncbi:hypothetical protein HK096_010316 [Nowakowskiella sp. JEL0078]|nr:hypothetical protein HK096_010316 [Nowakowskiella sp. JEL0078]